VHLIFIIIVIILINQNFFLLNIIVIQIAFPFLFINFQKYFFLDYYYFLKNEKNLKKFHFFQNLYHLYFSKLTLILIYFLFLYFNIKKLHMLNIVLNFNFN